jgi:hypothetical protein
MVVRIPLLRGYNDQRAKIQLAPQADTTIITGIDDMALDVSEIKAATMRLWKEGGWCGSTDCHCGGQLFGNLRVGTCAGTEYRLA